MISRSSSNQWNGLSPRWFIAFPEISSLEVSWKYIGFRVLGHRRSTPHKILAKSPHHQCMMLHVSVGQTVRRCKAETPLKAERWCTVLTEQYSSRHSTWSSTENARLWLRFGRLPTLLIWLDPLRLSPLSTTNETCQMNEILWTS